MSAAVTADQWSDDKWTHEAVMAMQAKLSPGEIERIGDQWNALVGDLDEMFSTFLDDVARTMEDQWRGPGAEATFRVLRDYVESSRTTLDQARDLSSGLAALSAAAADLRQQITAPPSDLAVQRAVDRMGARSAEMTRSFSLQEALGQVRELYSGPAVAAGNAIAQLSAPAQRIRLSGIGIADLVRDPPGEPAFDEAHDDTLYDDPVHDEQSARAREFLARLKLSGIEPGAAMNTETPMRQQNSGTEYAVPAHAGGRGSSAGDLADELAEDDIFNNQNWLRDPLGRDTSTHSAGTDSPDAPVGGGRGATALMPDRSPSAGPAPNPPTAAPVSAGSSGSAPRATGSMMPMGVFGGHPAQRRGDENEHYTPAYLVNRDNTNELLGELPAASVPVIGLWDGADTESPVRRGR